MKMKFIFLSVMMMLVPVMTLAHDIEVTNADGVTIYYSWINDNTELAVSNFNHNVEIDSYAGNVVIPEFVEYNGSTYRVTSIGDGAFEGCSGLTSVTIPNSVTEIGEMAFWYCSGLTSIKVAEGNEVFDSRDNCNAIIKTVDNALMVGCRNTVIPNSVTTIGRSAFSGCSGLTSVTIPNSVTLIGMCAFSDCSGLTSVTIGSGVTSIGDGAFGGCSGLTSVTIPNSVTEIGELAFCDCSGLTSVTIGSGVTSIRDGAFEGCSGLTSVHVLDIETIAAWCNIGYVGFSSAYRLYLNGEEISDLVIPNSVTTIGGDAFHGCLSLTSVTIPNSVTYIGWAAFQDCTSLTSVTFGSGVTEIGGSAFRGCSSLTSINFQCSPTSVGDNIFQDCIKIKEVTLDCEEVIFSLFRNLSSITKITMTDKVTSIEDGAFEGCSGLTSLAIGSSVTSIGGRAFYGCSSLTSVTIPNSVTSIGYDAFRDCSGLTSVHVFDIAAWCNISYGGSVFSAAYRLYLNGEEISDLVIPNSVTSIGGDAFQHCSGLTSVTIPNSVTSIGWYAFAGCTNLQFVKSFITEPYSINRNVFPDEVYRQCLLYIPAGTEKLYNKFDGWREFLKIEEMDGSEQPEIPGAEKCATPTISYEDGKLSFSCQTEGVEYKYKIEANDAKEGYGNDIQMTKTYNVTVYAIKDGMNNSDPAIAIILIDGGKEGDVNGDGVVDAADIVKVTKIIMGK